MKPLSLLAFAALLPVAACASAGAGSGSDSPAPLAHAVPQGGQATYVQADTILVELDAGGQTFEVKQSQASTLEMTFREAADGTEITATFVAFDGRIDNPMAGQARFGLDAIDGPLVFSLTPRGAATIVSAPQIETEASALLNAESLAATLFPRLPERVVTAGNQWTDTLELEVEVPDGVIRMNSVTEYTVRGDSVVAGETLLAVDFVSEDTRFAEVAEAGMDVVQDVAGTMRGHFLWDASRNRVHSQVGSGSYTGTMEVPSAPFPLGMKIEVVSRLNLTGG
jgi:hypothetical protein